MKTVTAIEGVDFTRTYSNNYVENFNVLGTETAHAAIMKEMLNIIEFDGFIRQLPSSCAALYTVSITVIYFNRIVNMSCKISSVSVYVLETELRCASF